MQAGDGVVGEEGVVASGFSELAPVEAAGRSRGPSYSCVLRLCGLGVIVTVVAVVTKSDELAVASVAA